MTVIAVPGSAYHYSGGGYEIAETLVADALHAPFPEAMDALVLKLAEITHSTFAQPLPSELAPVARRNLTIAIGGAEKQVSLAEAMAALDIPAASIALIDQDQIAFARAYGDGVASDRQFQGGVFVEIRNCGRRAGLVDQKRLSLDTDVNAGLTSWKVLTNAFDKDQRVTFRGLLSMTQHLPRRLWR